MVAGGRRLATDPTSHLFAARTNPAELETWLDNPTAMMGIKSMPICPGWAFCADFQWAIDDVALEVGEKLRGFARRRPTMKSRSKP